MKFYYSHGRTAFKYGLKYLNLKMNDRILMPNYICDILLDPLKDLEINPIFYKVNKDFTCDFKNIKKKWNKSVKALLIINYFGYEEDKEKYFNFCKKRKIYLIEDSCHSFSTKLTNKKKISDVIFYSPKKLIPELYTGGLLKINNLKKDSNILKKKINIFNVSYYELINTFLEKNLLSFKRHVKFLIFKMPTFHKLNSIKNIKISNDYLMDKSSLKKLHKIDLNKILRIRKKNYILWTKFCLKSNLITPINRKINKNTIPWLLPVYINNPIVRKKIMNFGWKNGYSIISWPRLPKTVVNKHTKKIWNSLVCFNTDRAPDKKDNVNF